MVATHITVLRSCDEKQDFCAFGSMIFDIMPSSGLCRIKLVETEDEQYQSAFKPPRDSAPCGIVRYASQVLEEAQQLIIGPVRPSLAFDGCSLREHLLFQSKIGIEIDLGC